MIGNHILTSLLHKVEEKGTILADGHIGVVAFGLIRRKQSRPGEEILLLRRPMHGVGRSVNPQTGPDIDDHPDTALPAKDNGAFAGAVVDGYASRRPLIEIGTVHVMDVAMIAFILVPQAPTAIVEPKYVRIDCPVRRQGQR